MNHLRLLFAVALATAACRSNPQPGSSAYKKGELGNGDFLFACDDGIACLPYSNDANKFPDAIATGSNFNVRFVANGEEGSAITVNEKRYTGVTLRALPPYVGDGRSGLAALQPGYGTVIVHDSAGFVIDYVTLKIVRPSGLVVYDASADIAKNREPPRLQSLTLKVGDTPSYRVVAEHDQRLIAGSILVDWQATDSSIVDVESYTGGVVNLRAKAPGTTTLKAVGAALEKNLDVTVSQ